VRCEVTKDLWRTDYRAVDYVTKPGAPVSTVGSFVVAAGKRVIEKA
jgi:alkaline phosphatase D